jgi:hypothetical protein
VHHPSVRIAGPTDSLLVCSTEEEGIRVTPADSLLLDAKQAILSEQHRRFQALQQEGRWQEALQQFQITMTCAAELLAESLRLLEQTLKKHQRGPGAPDPRASEHIE